MTPIRQWSTRRLAALGFVAGGALAVALRSGAAAAWLGWRLTHLVERLAP